MKPVRIAIADDDADMRNVVRKIIERDGGYELVGEAENGAELVELFDREHPQALILDVEMPVMTGIECARAIQDRDPGTVIIFSTAHDQYMQDAFELYAFDYLLKPFKLERALKTLELVRERLAEREKAVERTIAEGPARAAAGRIMLRHKEGVSLISVENIILVQREERMTVIYTSDGNRYYRRFAGRDRRKAAGQRVHPHAQVVHREHQLHRLDHTLRPVDLRRKAARNDAGRADHSREV